MSALLAAMTNDDIKRLGDLLKVANQNLDPIPKGEMIRSIIDWTTRWKHELFESYQQLIIDISDADGIWRQHRDFNNKLVAHGFYDFAYEVMMIEQPHYVM